MRIALIVNPSAGNGRARRALPDVEAALARYGVDYHLESTDSLEHARTLALAAAGAGEPAVALGGDGLIGAVAGALEGTDGVVGMLPGGRGNDFARMLGIPLDPAGACAVIAAGIVRTVDLGAVGAETFIGIASCGFDSEANRVANQTRLVRGSLVYAYGAMWALARWKPATFEVCLDDREPLRFTGYTVAAANSKSYGGGMLMAPDASVEDGLLDVVIVEHLSKLGFARVLPTVFKGEHVRLPYVQVHRAREVRISADRKFTLYADGDPVADLPVTIRALAHAVRVIVPTP